MLLGFTVGSLASPCLLSVAGITILGLSILALPACIYLLSKTSAISSSWLASFNISAKVVIPIYTPAYKVGCKVPTKNNKVHFVPYK